MSILHTIVPRGALLAALACASAGCSTAFTVDQVSSSRAAGVMTTAPEPAEVVAHVHLEGDEIRIDEQIQFELGAAHIEAASDALLDEIGALIRDNPQLGSVSIEGHTDDRGSASFNERLSQARAEAVRDALVERGVEPERLHAAGFGERRPLVPNDSDAGRTQNRRVEFHISKDGAS